MKRGSVLVTVGHPAALMPMRIALLGEKKITNEPRQFGPVALCPGKDSL